MKKLIIFVLIFVLLFSMVGCVDHDDGVCDYYGCDATIGVIRYNKNNELCLKHAHEEGFI